MTLTGHLDDYPLGDLIEIFRHRHETGCLKVAYQEAPGFIYFKNGEIVDARVGTPSSLQRLSGTAAVKLALTLPSAPFEFTARIESPRHAIDEAWSGNTTDELDFLAERSTSLQRAAATAAGAGTQSTQLMVLPLPPPRAGTKKGFRLWEEKGSVGVTGALLMCALATLIFTNRFRENSTAENTSTAVVASLPVTPVIPVAPVASPAAEAPGISAANSAESTAPAAATTTTTMTETMTETRPAETNSGKARRDGRASRSGNSDDRDAGRRPRQQSSAAFSAREDDSTITQNSVDTMAPAGMPSSSPPLSTATTPGSQNVTVVMQVGANGRVSQAYVSNRRPGMEAYEASALRIARGRRYPTGKEGWETVQIKVDQPK